MKVSKNLYNISFENNFFSHTGDTQEEKKLNFGKQQDKYRKLSFINEEHIADFEENQSYSYLLKTDRPMTVQRDDLVEMMVSNIQFKVIQEINIDLDISQQLMDLAEKPSITLKTEQGNEYNTKCEVHMPGMALAMYNEVRVMTNECTDSLQEHLQTGWRIIAACPQPNQRRPDYVLGRFNPGM